MLLSVRSFTKKFAVSAMVLSAGLPLSALAQRAPELLPAQVKLIAGSGTAAVASGGTCPVSGNKATDAYGDGCLATEVLLGTSATAPGPRYAVADANGNVFFSDYANFLIRRVDAITGIVTAVAGTGTSTPGLGAACGTATSIDALGDGCLGTSIKLAQHPMGLAFAPNGDLYFSEADFVTGTTGGAHVRKIASTGGFITTTGTVTLVLGQSSNAKGYAANPSTCTNTVTATCITAANSYLYAPYGISTNAAGLLFVAEEYKEAMLVFNPTATNATVNNIPVPAGTISKLVGGNGTSGTTQDCPNSPLGTNGCTYGLTTFGGQAATSLIDSSYAVTPDALGNLYYANEYYNYIGKVSTAGVLTDFAGIQNAAAKNLTRATAGANGIGSSFGITTDAFSNVYFTDASSGVIFRVDADTSTQYVIAGGATTVCSTGDTYGNGCPATQSTFGKSASSTGLYATATLPGPGIYGITVDAYGNLYTGDTETNEVREVATGAQFGSIGNTQPTNTLIVHFAPTDGPASSTPYVITAGMNNFAVGTPGACTANTDGSQDCPVPVQATPTILGPFTGTLTVTSSKGKTAAFPLSGTFVTSRVTRTVVTLTSSGTACTGGGSIYSTGTSLTLTATISSTGTPGGTVQFYNGTTAIGGPISVLNGVAKLTQTFPLGSYSITAVYSGDINFNTSTSATPVTFSTQTPSFSFAAVTTTSTPNVVSAGGTALYSFTLPSTLYSGTVTFSCSGLPSGTSCVFSPLTITGTGCTLTGTSAPVVTMNIYTTAAPSTISAGFTSGCWMMFSGFFLALLIGLNRRRLTVRFVQLSLALAFLLGASGLTACSSGTVKGPAATPSGSYPITVTAADSNGTAQTVSVNLTVK